MDDRRLSFWRREKAKVGMSWKGGGVDEQSGFELALTGRRLSFGGEQWEEGDVLGCGFEHK